MNTNAEPNAMANIKNIVSVIYEVPSNLVDAKVYTILEKQVYKWFHNKILLWSWINETQKLGTLFREVRHELKPVKMSKYLWAFLPELRFSLKFD